MKETLMADEFILFLQSKEWSSKEIFDIPGEMGCDPAQSKPLSENEFKRWLSTSPWRL
ncbi:MAG: hypothetical protein MUO63_22660 [Desulfobulbaceae bacterium]|nr:hypothetical protein [Desulfobulbaceae bacterium]